MKTKQIVMRTILMVEMVVFVHLYIFGKNGLQLLQVQKKQLQELQATAQTLHNDVELLEQEIFAWETNDFYKEKIAREQLQMARKDDKLFYIGWEHKNSVKSFNDYYTTSYIFYDLHKHASCSYGINSW